MTAIDGCKQIYAPRGQAGEYAPLATNPYRGCGHGCAYCLAPDTLVQMADGTTRPISAVRIGDELVGIAPRPQLRRAWNYTFTASRVLSRISTRTPALEFTLANGLSATCSADHRWLTERGWKLAGLLTTNNEVRVLGAAIETPIETETYQRGYLAGIIRGDGTLKRYDYSGRFQRAGRKVPQRTDVQHHFRLALKDAEALDRTAAYLSQHGIDTHHIKFAEAVGARSAMDAIRTHSAAAFEKITRLIEVRSERDWLRGWLAGIFDAEGGTSSGVLRIHNTDEAILSLTDRALATFGFRTIRDSASANGCSAVRILGGLSEIVRFFNLTAPAIRRKFPIVGNALRGSSKIVAVRPLGREIEMVDITTSTENFIANGMISHNCYVPRVLHMDRRDFDAGATLRPGYFDALIRDARRYEAAGIREQVMLSFTTDPYHPGDNTPTRRTLEILIAHGLGVCTLTKGGSRALRDLDLFRPDRDAFASTLTSLDEAFSRKWERAAAAPADRVSTLRKFHERGIFTWVSLEPTLDIESSLAIVRETHAFVDLFKIGRVNYLPMTRTTDWRGYTLRMIDLLNRLGARHYIKKDLQSYLPPGYPNPLRVPQHR